MARPSPRSAHPPRRVVVTGGTRGIGFGLVRAFARRGCPVMLAGRTRTGVDAALAALEADPAPQGADPRTALVAGHPCDVADADQLQALWDAARERFGGVDVWINNAGVDLPHVGAWKLEAAEVERIVATNLLGAMHGSTVAVRGMLAQGGGRVFNMEGLGSDGRIVAGAAVYGATKAALTHYTRTLAKDLRSTPVRAALLSPGIVLTDLWGDPEQLAPAAEFVMRALGDRVEPVAEFLAARVLADPPNGARVAWLTRAKILRRFALAPLRRGRLGDLRVRRGS